MCQVEKGLLEDLQQSMGDSRKTRNQVEKIGIIIGAAGLCPATGTQVNGASTWLEGVHHEKGGDCTGSHTAEDSCPCS